MDHKVSKDMISSGMTPSGEKTQADLGRTQYGSAPSPSRLMDAYKSIYKEENIDSGKDYDSLASGRQKFVSQLNKKTPVSGPGQGKPKVGKVKTTKVDPQTLKNNPRADVQTNSFDLLASYRAVYEHHKKDADGNTIPHEGEEVKEENINELKSRTMLDYIDKASDSASKELDKAEKTTSRKKEVKARLKMDKRERGIEMAKDKIMKRVKEDADLFDVISTHFINEGYEEKDIYKAMSSLTGDQLQNLDEAIPLIGGALAALGKVGAGIGAKVAAAGGAKAIAAKGLASAGKMATGAAKGIASAGKQGLKTLGSQVAKAPSPLSVAKQVPGNVAKNVGGAVKGVASMPGKISSGVKKIGGAVKNFYGNEKISPFVKQAATSTAMDLGMRAVGGMKPRGLQKRTSGTISADADLFDIVKGQLLDEGLSEEEIKDIMLTLTPDEIIKELEESSLSAGSSGGHYSDGGDGVFRSKQQVANMFNKNIPAKRNGKVDKPTRKAINTSAKDFGIQGPSTLKQSVEPEGETI